MAQALSKSQIKALPVRPYAEVRGELHTGDLMFCSGSYFFSGLIQRFTRSVWSHIGMIYRDDHLGRIFVLESETMIGVRLAPVSKYLDDYHGRHRPYRGQVVIARVEPEVSTEALKRAISFGMDELTKPYDNVEILRIAARILFRVGRRTRDRKYICSELVDAAYRRAGVNLRQGDGYVSPDDIWRDDGVRQRFRIL